MARYNERPAGDGAGAGRRGNDRNNSDRPYNDRGEKKIFNRRDKYEGGEGGERRSFGSDRREDRKPYGDRREGGERRSFGGDRREGERRSFGSDRREGGEGRRSFGGDRREGGSERRSFGGDRPNREGGERRSFGADRREGGDRRSFGGDRREDNERRSFSPKREGGERRTFGSDRREGGERRNFGADRREGSERRSFGAGRREGEDRRSFGSDRREDRKPYGERREGGERRSFGGERSFNSDREDSRGYREDRGFNKDRAGADRDDKRAFKVDRLGKQAGRNRRLIDHAEGEQAEAPTYNIKRYESNPRIKKSNRREAEDDGTIRLNRYIANAGVCSRREADSLIEAGEIKVNGQVVTEMGYKVNPSDTVQYGKKILNREKLVYVLLNKPKDFITTTEDPEGRKTVMDLVAKASKERIFPVGRLDRNTTGLLLFTNDGELAQKLTHPSNDIRKIYQVELDKPITKDDYQKIVEGLELEDGKAEVDDLAMLGDTGKFLGIEIHIGRNRIVRRIFEHLGYDVVSLDRVQYAGLTKKDLPRGNWRFLSEKELIRLKYFV
ncbi:pseudouridine synthase [Pontibacter sp. SGAir0037]|uniref:pseudouridine synthase n=1 Tax=Pontibacter sp. SGAir0037 TaxID=2571030 RepID=UPI0010CCB2FF|nr:pseudouridine synthase [Pontibacter sp. SGAir0037]QCR24035.1 pseudouridylate synthase [Pontibacter sp. SGAir0037]